jgi:general secretion pathway protein M
VVSVLFWFLVTKPLHERLERAKDYYQQASQLHADILRLPLPLPSQSLVSGSSLASALINSASSRSVTISQMNSEESGRHNLVVEGSLDDLVNWLDEIEKNGINLVSLEMEISTQTTLKINLIVEKIQ